MSTPTARDAAGWPSQAARAGLIGLAGVVGVMGLTTLAAWLFTWLAAPEATVVMTYLLGVIVVAGAFGRGSCSTRPLRAHAVVLAAADAVAMTASARADDRLHLEQRRRAGDARKVLARRRRADGQPLGGQEPHA